MGHGHGAQERSEGRRLAQTLHSRQNIVIANNNTDSSRTPICVRLLCSHRFLDKCR